MVKYGLLLLSLIFIMPWTSIAETTVIYADYRYTLGDSDSKNDARRLCLMEAKRSALEKAGTYVETMTEINNLEVTKDEIFIYSAALVKTKTIEEKWAYDSGVLSVYMKVRAEIDFDDLQANLLAIQKSRQLKQQLGDLEKRLQRKEKRSLALFQILAMSNPDAAMVLLSKKTKKDAAPAITAEIPKGQPTQDLADSNADNLRKTLLAGPKVL